MTPALYIALRFLTNRKRALLLSLSGVVFGVAIFICTQAQTQGFAQNFINSTIGSNGAVVMRSRFRPRYEKLIVASGRLTCGVPRIRSSVATPTVQPALTCIASSSSEMRSVAAS